MRDLQFEQIAKNAKIPVTYCDKPYPLLKVRTGKWQPRSKVDPARAPFDSKSKTYLDPDHLIGLQVAYDSGYDFEAVALHFANGGADTVQGNHRVTIFRTNNVTMLPDHYKVETGELKLIRRLVDEPNGHHGLQPSMDEKLHMALDQHLLQGITIRLAAKRNLVQESGVSQLKRARVVKMRLDEAGCDTTGVPKSVLDAFHPLNRFARIQIEEFKIYDKANLRLDRVKVMVRETLSKDSEPGRRKIAEKWRESNPTAPTDARKKGSKRRARGLNYPEKLSDDLSKMLTVTFPKTTRDQYEIMTVPARERLVDTMIKVRKRLTKEEKVILGTLA